MAKCTDMNDFSTNMMAGERSYSEKKIRVGIIGTGGICASHIKGYLNQPDVEIVAGADLIPGKAEKRMTELGVVGAKYYTDFRQMIAEVPMDAVSVCTYNRTHAECAIYALEHGLHVLLEKPFTFTLDEAVEVMKAEKKSGKVLSIGFQPRFDANMQMIKKIVQSGELGKVYYVQTGGGRRHGIPAKRDSFLKEETAGYGALGDIGCYSLDLVMNALGHPKPLRVTGMATNYFGTTPEAYAELGLPERAEIFTVDDFASAYIRLENDIIIDFRIAWYMHLDTPGDTIIMGTKGSLRVPSTECWNGTLHKPMTIYHDIAGKPVETVIPLLPKSEIPLPERKVRAFLDAIIEGKKSPIPSDEIIYNQAILDGIYRSSQLGHEVEIEIPEI